MNARRGVLAAVAAWLVVVVVGSTLAWAVISRAGEEVGDPSDAATGAAPTTTATSKPTSKPTGRKTRTEDPTSATTTSDPTTSGSTPPPATTTRRTRTWQGLGGLVVVECKGKVVRLVGAQADSGFHVEVNHRGPDRVEVEFEGRGDNEGKESRVRAFCVNGTPTFDVDTDDD